MSALPEGGRDREIAALAVTAVLALEGARARGVDLSFASLRDALRESTERDPMRAALMTVIGSTVLFYLAEKGKNPRVRSFEDALVFTTTCLSVGYAQTFAETSAGKAIASALMTFGPALSARILDAPARETQRERDELVAVQRTIASKLDVLIEAVQSSRAK